MARYDDSKFGETRRKYFYAEQAAKTLSSTNLLKRYYPKGPIRITKFGVMHIATQGGTETTITLKRNASTLATVVASTDSAPWTIASKAVSDKDVDAGSYLAITSGGGVATGSVVCFIEYHNLFDDNFDI